MLDAISYRAFDDRLTISFPGWPVKEDPVLATFPDRGKIYRARTVNAKHEAAKLAARMTERASRFRERVDKQVVVVANGRINVVLQFF